MTQTLLAALTWDPQIRGFLIFLTAVIVLPGSVFMLLATNTGAKLGFLLAATGLAGWMATMGFVWMIFGIGLKGRDPHWKVEDVITGEVVSSPIEALEDFPRGEWKELPPGNAIRGDAAAAADDVLLPDEGAGHSEEGGVEAEPAVRLGEAPFQSADGYIQVAAYRKGGENYWPGGVLEADPFEPQDSLAERIGAKGFRHRPHYAVIQVRPVVDIEETPNAAPRPPVADESKPITTVVMVRDLGSVRFPPFVIGTSSLVIFLVLCNVLHRRDKEIMALRAAGTASA